LVQVGGTLSLLVPLLLLSRTLERWVERREGRGRVVSSDLPDISPPGHTVAAELDGRDQLTRQQLVNRHQERERLFVLAEREPTQARIRQLLSYTSDIEATPESGMRVGLQLLPVWLRFRLADNPTDIAITVEDRAGRVIADASWTPEQSERALLAEVARLSKQKVPVIRRQEETPPVLNRLVAALRLAASARTGSREHDLGQLVEVVNEQWAISSDALFCLDRYYRVPAGQLVDGRLDVRRHVLAKSWVKRDLFEEAFQTATALFARG
jgi:hypothetical protein